MDRIGRRQTMTLGFLGWTILGFIIGGALSPIQSVFPLFIVLYGIFNALGEMGPGVSPNLDSTATQRHANCEPGRHVSVCCRVLSNTSTRPLLRVCRSNG